MRAVAVVVVVIAVAGGARAQGEALNACRSPDQVLAGLVIPVDGAAGVPTNVTPFVGGGGGALELLLVGDDGAEIPAQIEAIEVGSAIGASGTIKQIVPAGELNPGQNITVVADGAAVTHFTVGGDGADTDAPGAPDVGVGSSCEGQGGTTLTVGVANDDAVLFVGVVDGQPVIGGGARVDGVASQNDELTVFGTGSAEVNVAGVDLAGNVGASTPVKVRFPEVPGFSCASTASSSAPLWLVLSAFLRVRSRAATSRRRPR
jgi:hypothetical protein